MDHGDLQISGELWWVVSSQLAIYTAWSSCIKMIIMHAEFLWHVVTKLIYNDCQIEMGRGGTLAVPVPVALLCLNMMDVISWRPQGDLSSPVSCPVLSLFGVRLINWLLFYCLSFPHSKTAKLEKMSPGSGGFYTRQTVHKLLIVNQASSWCLCFQVLTVFSHSILLNHLSSSGCFAKVLQRQFPLLTKCRSEFTACYPLLLHWKSPDQVIKWNVVELYCSYKNNILLSLSLFFF